MENLVIDTNLLYALSGISPNNKVNPDDFLNSHLHTTTANLAEVIVKYRNNLELLKKCILFVQEKCINVLDVPFFQLDKSIIEEILKSDNCDILKMPIQKIKFEKIRKEAEILRFVLYLVAFGGIHTLRDHYNYKFSNTQDDDQLINAVQAIMTGNCEETFSIFKRKLVQGYYDGNEQKTVLSTFDMLLFSIITSYCGFYHLIKSESTKELNSSISSDKLFQQFIKSDKNPFYLIKNKPRETIFNTYQQTLLTELSNKIEGGSLSFLLARLETIFRHDAKFRKNDTFDFLTCCALDNIKISTDRKIITLDNGFLKILKTIHYDSWCKNKELGYC